MDDGATTMYPPSPRISSPSPMALEEFRTPGAHANKICIPPLQVRWWGVTGSRPCRATSAASVSSPLLPGFTSTSSAVIPDTAPVATPMFAVVQRRNHCFTVSTVGLAVWKTFHGTSGGVFLPAVTENTFQPCRAYFWAAALRRWSGGGALMDKGTAGGIRSAA